MSVRGKYKPVALSIMSALERRRLFARAVRHVVMKSSEGASEGELLRWLWSRRRGSEMMFGVE